MLQAISITEAKDVPWGIMKAARFLPDEVTFDKPALLSFSIPEHGLPPEVRKESLRVAVLDGGAWKILRDSRFDPASGTVSDSIKHFSIYGLVAEPGKFSYRGTSFEVNGITARTQDSVFGRLFVAPSFISFYAEADVAAETSLTISGLPTDGEHHIYINSHDEHYILVPFDGGEITLTLNLDGPSLVWVQPQESTIVIGGGPEVDECPSYGDRAVDVCTLTTDIVGDVELRGGTLDCDGHSITQPAAYGGTGIGVLVPPNVYGAVIDNCVIGSGSGYFAYGIEAHGADTVVASNNTLEGNIIGVLLQGASHSFVSDNHFSGTSLWAVALWESSLNNEVSGNSIDVDNDAITIEGLVVAPASSGNRVFDNTITRGTGGILLAKTSDNTVKQNTISGVLTALSISSGAWPNDIYRNNFQGSIYGIYSTLESIDLSNATYGGNWWGHSCPEPLFTPGVDGVPDSVTDNRAYGQKDAWLHGISPGCPGDTDGDGVPDASDNCPGVTNPDQANSDGLGGGDACDEEAPLPPVITSPANGSSTNELRPPFEGTAERGSLVRIMECGTSINELGSEYEWCGQIASGPADAGGFFHLLPENQLSGGEHVVHATATDAAGNTSARSNIVRFTIDISQPLPLEITHPYPGEIVRELPLAVQGICQLSFAIHVFDYGVPLGSTSCAAGGVFELLAGDLAAGDHELTASTINLAGTPSLPSDPVRFSVRLVSAAAPISGMRGKAQVTGISDAPDPFSPIDEASNLAVSFRVSGVEGLEWSPPNQKFEARLLWVIRDQGTFLPTRFLQSTAEIPKGATPVQGTVQASWDGTNAWGAMVGIGQIFDYDVSLTVVRRYVGPGMGPRCPRGETPLFFGPGPRACVVDQVFAPVAGTIRITLPRQSLPLTSVYVSGDGYENRGTALYDFDNDNVYEERTGTRHVFHATFTSEENITHARVFFNRQDDPACEGDVSIKDASVFTEIDLRGVAPRCFWWNAGYAIVEAIGVSGRTWTGIAMFDFFRKEDWGYAEKRCDGVQQRIVSPEGPCIGLSEKCMDGQFEDGTNCCSLNPALNGLPCDDGDPSTTDDRCFMGQCSGGGDSGDVDGDGVPDPSDDVLGDGWWLRTGMPDPYITARADETKVGSITEVSIYSQGRPVVRYWRRAGAPQLVASDILVDGSRPWDEIGFVAVDGIDDFIERYSWVFVENLAASNDVCILKASPFSAPVLHSDCSGDGEIKVSCAPDAPAVGNMTCRGYGDWLKVRVDPPAIVWQVREDRPFEMRLRTGETDGTRMKGITACTDQEGPNCSDIYCSPGVDADCLAVRNVCRFGTGPCARLDWVKFDELSVPDACTTGPCSTPGLREPCTVGVCQGRRTCRGDTTLAQGCWSSCRRNDGHILGPERCNDMFDNDCDGLINETMDFTSVGRYGFRRRNICNDYDICTSDSCSTLFTGTIPPRPVRNGECIHNPAPPPSTTCIPECAEWACHSDEEGWVKEPHDEFCVDMAVTYEGKLKCPDCFSNQCVCPALDYCNPDACGSENPSGCEKYFPCDDPHNGADSFFCTQRICADNTDQFAREQCNPLVDHENHGELNYDWYKWAIDRCLFGGGTKTCKRARAFDNPCCDPGTTTSWYTPAEWECAIAHAFMPWWLADWYCAGIGTENYLPECSNPLSVCPLGASEQVPVHHPIEDMDVGFVYCTGYPIMTDCSDHFDDIDACNARYCDLQQVGDTFVGQDICSQDFPPDDPDHPQWGKEQDQCDDGLACTVGDKCVPDSRPIENTTYIYTCEGTVDPTAPGYVCDPDYCDWRYNQTVWPNRMTPCSTTHCAQYCGDPFGWGNRITDPPCLPENEALPNTGCQIAFATEFYHPECYNTNMCFETLCDEALDQASLREIHCPDDGATCSDEYCDPSRGCQQILNDWMCDDWMGCTIDRCDPPNSPPLSWYPGCVNEPSDQWCIDNCIEYGYNWCRPYQGHPECGFCDVLM